MSAAIQLPPSLHERIGSVARRVRLLRSVRGVSLLVLVLALTAGGALLADFLLGGRLPVSIRALNLTLWIGLGSLLLVNGLILPLRRRLDPADVAAVIEERHPQLGERLTSSVELCESADPGNGSPTLIELLVRETEARSAPLDFLSSVSAQPTRRLAFAAAVVTLLALFPAALYPADYGLLVKRFLLPWTTPHGIPDFAFHVQPGDTVAAKGRPLTVAVELTPRSKRMALPRTVNLVVLGADGIESRHEMTGDESSATRYAVSYRVPGDFHYRIEAGNATSADYAVQTVTPVDLLSESPTLVVTPPQYASSTIDGETFTGLVDLTVLKHSEVAFAFRFTRPAVSAVLELLDGTK
jgi:hypothetical protein